MHTTCAFSEQNVDLMNYFRQSEQSMYFLQCAFNLLGPGLHFDLVQLCQILIDRDCKIKNKINVLQTHIFICQFFCF